MARRALGLLGLQGPVDTIGGLATAVEPRVVLSIPGRVEGEVPFDFVLGYEFREREPRNEGCLVGFRGWEIAGAFTAS